MAGVVISAPALAEQAPRWEAGAGVAVVSIPDYRGADEGHTYVLPVPYFVYRGDWLKVDRGGIRTDLQLSENLILEASGNAGPPAKSNGNTARRHMPDIDPTFEVGPSLKWRWYESNDHGVKLALQLPVRTVTTIHFENIGWVFAPSINLDVRDIGPGGGWNFGVSAGPIYATEKYHDYYYEVPPRFALPQSANRPARPAFDADGGYSGSRLILSLSKRFSRIWAGAYLRYDSLRGAVFEDSPLVRERHNLSGGFGVSYIFARSTEMVEVRNENPNP